VVVAVRNRPLKIKTIDQSGEFVRGHPPLFTAIAVKLLSTDGPLARSSYRSPFGLAPIFS
jgi:hypothetical protein